MGFFDLFSSEKKKGSLGEKEIGWELGIHSLLGKHGKVFKNLYVPAPGNKTSEIDLLFLCQKGIFVIESKNVKGFVYGSEWQQNWTVLLFGGTKNLLYNPIKQNATHVKRLQTYLKELGFEAVPYQNVVIFSDQANLDNVTWMDSNTKVLQVRGLSSYLNEIWKEREYMLTKEQVNELSKALEPLTKASKTTKEDHVKWVNRVKEAEDPERE